MAAPVLSFYINVSSNDSAIWSSARSNDVLLYLESNSQRVLIGNRIDAVPSFNISSNAIYISNNLDIASSLLTNGTTRISSTGALTNVTADASIITTGTLAVARGGTGTTTTTGTGSLVLNSNPSFGGIVNGTFNGTISGNGANLSNLSFANITTGTVSVANGGTGTSTSTGTGSLVLNSNPAFGGTPSFTGKISTPQFSTIQVFNSLFATLDAGVSYTSNSSTFTINGGTLLFFANWSWWNNTGSQTNTMYFTLSNSSSAPFQFSNSFFFNQAGVHHACSDTRVATGIPAGTYFLTALVGGTAGFVMANDFLKVNILQLPI